MFIRLATGRRPSRLLYVCYPIYLSFNISLSLFIPLPSTNQSTQQTSSSFDVSDFRVIQYFDLRFRRRKYLIGDFKRILTKGTVDVFLPRYWWFFFKKLVF